MVETATVPLGGVLFHPVVPRATSLSLRFAPLESVLNSVEARKFGLNIV